MKVQKNFKKVLSLLLSFAFILSMASVPIVVQAAPPTPVEFSVGDFNGVPGSDIVVSINISANSDLAAAGMLLKYDTTKLLYKKNTKGAASLDGLSSVNPNKANDGVFRTIYDGYVSTETETVNEGGSMLNVTFTVLSGWTGTTPLELSIEKCLESVYIEGVLTNIPLDYVTINGSVNIPSPVTVTFDTAGGTSIAPVTGLSGDALAIPGLPTKKGYTFGGWNPALPATFPAADTEYTANWNKVPVTLSVTSASGLANTDVTISVLISADSGLAAADLFLKFDNQKLTFKSAANGAATAGGYSYINAQPPVGDFTTIHQSFAINGGTVTAGSMMDITFTINPGWTGTTGLVLTNEDFYDDDYTELFPTITNGNVECTFVATSTITFDLDGADSAPIAPITGDVGDPVPSVADPIWVGYNFLGWEPGLPTTFEEGGTDVVAQWEPASIVLTVADGAGASGDTVTIDVDITGNSGVAAADLFLTFDNTKLSFVSAANGTATVGGISVINPQPPVGNSTAIHQSFALSGGISVAGTMMTVTFEILPGWTGTTPLVLTREDFHNDALQSLQPAIINGEVTCTFAGTSKISFDTDGGNAITAITGEIGTAVTAPADPIKEGYTFIGWSPDLPTTFQREDLEVTALWRLKQYTITFDANGGIGGDVQNVNHGVMPTVPADPTRVGYTFDEWTPELVAATADKTYTAQWLANDYTITFDSKGGSVVDSITKPYNTPVAKPTDPTRLGFTFDGWFYDADVAEIEITWPYTITENVEFFAKWTANTYNVKFDANGGTGVMADLGINFGLSATLTANTFALAGNTFANWNTAADGTGTPYADGATFGPMGAADVTLYAQWTANPTSTITFNTDGGSLIAPMTGEVGSPVTPPADPTREGYTFEGWDPVIPSTFPTEDLEVTALWEEIPVGTTYAITFDANGGVGGETQTVAEGVLPIAPVVTRAGYTFAGWDTIIVPATADATYVAQWTAIPTSTITFNTDGGSLIAPMTGEVGSPVTPPADPTREGYTFEGWEPSIPTTFPEEDEEVMAMWAKITTFTITFDADGGVGGEVQTLEAGVMPTPPVVTRLGYAFVEWTPAIVAVTEDATYTAVWEEVATSTITFCTLGGTVIDPITGNVGSDVPDVADPTLEGYIFVGWLPCLPETFQEDDLTVVAVWRQATSTITFLTMGGTAIDPITGAVGSAVTAPADPTKDGYTFIGWFPWVPTTFPYIDVVVVAMWKEILPETSTITFDTAGGNAIAPITGNVGSAVAAPANPTKEGYTFKGWSPVVPGTFPAGGLTVVAQWDKIEEVPNTGSALTGLAAFATFSMAAAAAFVMKKKKED